MPPIGACVGELGVPGADRDAGGPVGAGRGPGWIAGCSGGRFGPDGLPGGGGAAGSAAEGTPVPGGAGRDVGALEGERSCACTGAPAHSIAPTIPIRNRGAIVMFSL